MELQGVNRNLLEVWSSENVMIPKKRNKMGWWYTFARFHGVSSKHDLERSLDNVWIDSYKLRDNLSKYNEQISKLAPIIQKGRVLTPT